ncbi:MAG: Holliday junction resolvase RuvX [bacterium]|nr:Holliday junction resolvase RuvX [bacterium]
MRYLGIDYGKKRIGLAISDEEAKIAFPHSVLANNKEMLETIVSVVTANKIKTAVLGESKDFKGKDNPIMKDIQQFKAELEKCCKLSIVFEPEFLTSVQAARRHPRRPDGSRGSGLRAERRRPNEMLDASAAAIILQSYLDRRQPNS